MSSNTRNGPILRPRTIASPVSAAQHIVFRSRTYPPRPPPAPPHLQATIRSARSNSPTSKTAVAVKKNCGRGRCEMNISGHAVSSRDSGRRRKSCNSSSRGLFFSWVLTVSGIQRPAGGRVHARHRAGHQCIGRTLRARCPNGRNVIQVSAVGYVSDRTYRLSLLPTSSALTA